MAKVDLIHFTGKDTSDPTYYAARLLAFTKGTRLKMTPEGLDTFMAKPVDEIKDELSYMASTIASSWEFVDLIFSITDVSRACAQQITRTRTASYAMQSQRVTDMSEVTFHIPESLEGSTRGEYIGAMNDSRASYQGLINGGASKEDARGVLPINAHCNLIAKYNLRSWVDLVRSRDSLRVQGEYQSIARQMKAEVLAVWPWAATFVEPKAAKAIAMIEKIAQRADVSPLLRTELAKAADLIKKEGA